MIIIFRSAFAMSTLVLSADVMRSQLGLAACTLQTYRVLGVANPGLAVLFLAGTLHRFFLRMIISGYRSQIERGQLVVS